MPVVTGGALAALGIGGLSLGALGATLGLGGGGSRFPDIRSLLIAGIVKQAQAEKRKQDAFLEEERARIQPLQDESAAQFLQLLRGETPGFLAGPIGLQEEQLGQAKNALLNQGVRGGALQEQLANLQTQRLLGQDAIRSSFFLPSANLGFGQSNFLTNAGLQGQQLFSNSLSGISGLAFGSAQASDASRSANIGAFASGAGSLAALGFFSDRRLKQHIRKVLDAMFSPFGFALYAFEYAFLPGVTYLGVMAQDVIRTRPDAVTVNADGYLMVKYGMLV